MTNVLLMNRSFCYIFSQNYQEVFKEHPPVHFKLTSIEKYIFESDLVRHILVLCISHILQSLRCDHRYLLGSN